MPYRESKLTRILADSLAQKALLIACINPDQASYKESIATLQFVQQAKSGNQQKQTKDHWAKPTITNQEEMAMENSQIKDLTKQSNENQEKIEKMQKEIEDLKS